MAYEHKDGQGSMFRNEKQNDRQPDYKGTIMINGTVYEIAGWERTSQKGTSYISLQAGLPRERARRPAGQCPSPAVSETRAAVQQASDARTGAYAHGRGHARLRSRRGPAVLIATRII
ncbi:MAG: DUF736 domain-containing protein [Bacteroidales bacterium]|nr:DUF736 domain-containing protein [Bacteroidales bacterium]